MSFFAKKSRPPAPDGTVLFVHIPKTAGTSLRFELERQYHQRNVAADYGPSSTATTDTVREHMYQEDAQPRPLELINRLQSQARVALAGHYHLSKYGRFFPANRVVSIIRDPLLRAASEFLHKKRHNNFEGDFSEFFTHPNNINRITILLDDIEDGMIIGTTERYRESLQLINYKLGMQLRPAKKNVAPKGGAKVFLSMLNEKTIRRFEQLNQHDYDFYKKIDKALSEEMQKVSSHSSVPE